MSRSSHCHLKELASINENPLKQPWARTSASTWVNGCPWRRYNLLTCFIYSCLLVRSCCRWGIYMNSNYLGQLLVNPAVSCSSFCPLGKECNSLPEQIIIAVCWSGCCTWGKVWSCLPEYLLHMGKRLQQLTWAVSPGVAAAHGENVVTAYLSCHLELLLHMGKRLQHLPELSPGVASEHGEKVVTAFLSLLLEWPLPMGKRLY